MNPLMRNYALSFGDVGRKEIVWGIFILNTISWPEISIVAKTTGSKKDMIRNHLNMAVKNA